MKIYNNILSNSLMDECLLELADKRNYMCWGLSDFTWDSKLLVGVTGVCAMTFVSDEIKAKMVTELSTINPLFSKYELATQFYVWNKNSGIAAHNDGVYKFGATIYLNKNWKADYGGIFIWE